MTATAPPADDRRRPGTDGQARDLPSKITLDLAGGSCVRVETPGGGFGDPHGRDAAALFEDVCDGKVSAVPELPPP